ncbi:MAG: efflux RND transporter periplasmic adaptor subunit [Campylobacteraceae bacterium]
MSEIKKSSKIKWLVPILILGLIGFGIYKYFFATSNTNQTIATSTVTKGNIENVVTATGNITPKSSVDIGAQVSGQVMKLHVEVGDEVKIGNLLAEIDRTVLETKVESSEADLSYQKAQLKDKQSSLALAKITFSRQKELLENDATSLESYQSAEASLLSAEASIDMINAQIAQTESSLKENRANLEYTLIYATMNGTVVSVDVKEGQTLNANQNTPTILTIANLKTVTVYAGVSEGDVTKLKKGMEVYFTTLGSNNTWRTKLLKIEPTPTISNNVVLFNALFDVENPSSELMTSMTTQVFFVLSSAKDVLLIPMSAVDVKKDDATKGMVMVQKSDNSFEPRRVTLGVSNRVQIEVVSGLEEGEKVATKHTDLTTNKPKGTPPNSSNASGQNRGLGQQGMPPGMGRPR